MMIFHSSCSGSKSGRHIKMCLRSVVGPSDQVTARCEGNQHPGPETRVCQL